MSYGAAKAFYNSAAWTTTRRAYLESVCYICERCGKPAVIVHHRKYLTPDLLSDPRVTLDWDNLEALCLDCHNAEHMGGDACEPGLTFDDEGNLVAKGCDRITPIQPWYLEKP